VCDRRCEQAREAGEQNTAVPRLLAAALLSLFASAPHRIHVIDTGLCGFKLVANVTGRAAAGTEGTPLELRGPVTIRLRNADTGRTAVLHTSGKTWLGSEVRLPFLTNSRVLDPCAAVGPGGPLTRIAKAGLTPVTGPLVRHDHVHLDIFADGRRVTIPADVGQAEPVDDGPGRCPPPPTPPPDGDCAAGHFTTPLVAISPLHPHTTSGILHIESDRQRPFTLGQFFAEWGKPLAGSRVYVDGKLTRGSVVLKNGQEIAVVFGRAPARIPSAYNGRLPAGCGGPGEHACFK
jgi:hypothetical protein